MKKKHLILLLLATSFMGVHAQKSESLYIEAGGSYTSFQNTSYSNVIYNGFGSKFGLGYLKESPKNIWGVNLQIMESMEKPTTHNSGKASTNNYALQAKYLHNFKENLFIGITWDILDIYSKTFEGLGNNSDYDITGSTLWASGIYNYKKIRLGLDLGLVSYYRGGSGFAFNAPQSVLENGDLDYQNESLQSHFDFKHYELKTVNKHFQVRTNIRYQLTNRISVAYKWHFRKFHEVKNYATTYGIHSLSVRYNILNRSK